MLLKADNISFRYTKNSPWILRNVNMEISKGERVGIVGPSGYGKSTLARILSGYMPPSEGKVLWEGGDFPEEGYCPVQMIHQHPELSVNPRWRMKKILYEAGEPDRDLTEKMGIEASWLKRWPAELSGGELQRFCIARALGKNTRLLVCDEITTMLDVITQAQIWELLLEISKKRKLGMAVITHNMALAKKVCHRIISLPDINQIPNVNEI